MRQRAVEWKREREGEEEEEIRRDIDKYGEKGYMFGELYTEMNIPFFFFLIKGNT